MLCLFKCVPVCWSASGGPAEVYSCLQHQQFSQKTNINARKDVFRLLPSGLSSSLGLIDRPGRSLSAVDGNRQMTYSSIFKVFLNVFHFQKWFPRWLHIINHLVRELAAKHHSCNSRLCDDLCSRGSVGVTQSVDYSHSSCLELYVRVFGPAADWDLLIEFLSYLESSAPFQPQPEFLAHWSPAEPVERRFEPACFPRFSASNQQIRLLLKIKMHLVKPQNSHFSKISCLCTDARAV